MHAHIVIIVMDYFLVSTCIYKMLNNCVPRLWSKHYIVPEDVKTTDMVEQFVIYIVFHNLGTSQTAYRSIWTTTTTKEFVALENVT